MLPSEENPLWLQPKDVLNNSEQRVRIILDSAAEAICGCDSTDTCLLANRSAARILGYGSSAELLPRNSYTHWRVYLPGLVQLCSRGSGPFLGGGFLPVGDI